MLALCGSTMHAGLRCIQLQSHSASHADGWTLLLHGDHYVTCSSNPGVGGIFSLVWPLFCYTFSVTK